MPFVSALAAHLSARWTKIEQSVIFPDSASIPNNPKDTAIVTPISGAAPVATARAVATHPAIG